MKILNELVELANKANASGQGTPEMVEFRVVANPDNILDIAQAFRALERRAEAAESKLAELEKRKPDFHVRPIDTEHGGMWVECGADYHRGKHLYTRPAPAVSLAELVPEGWKLVPVEPTEEMLKAWRGDMYKSYAKSHIEHIGDDEIGFAWTAMITAAPTPSQ